MHCARCIARACPPTRGKRTDGGRVNGREGDSNVALALSMPGSTCGLRRLRAERAIRSRPIDCLRWRSGHGAGHFGAVRAQFPVDSYLHLLQSGVSPLNVGHYDYVAAGCAASLMSCGYGIQVQSAGLQLALGWSPASSLSPGIHSEHDTRAAVICSVAPDGSRWKMHSDPTARPADTFGQFQLILQSISQYGTHADTIDCAIHGSLHVSCLPGTEPGNPASGSLSIDFSL